MMLCQLGMRDAGVCIKSEDDDMCKHVCVCVHDDMCVQQKKIGEEQQTKIYVIDAAVLVLCVDEGVMVMLLYV